MGQATETEMNMSKKIDLQEYELLSLKRDEAYAIAAELLGGHFDLSTTNFTDAINSYIDKHYEWYRNDEEYQYMGYDCGDCYMGGDVKKGIVCGEYLVVYASCPTYKLVHIYKRK